MSLARPDQHVREYFRDRAKTQVTYCGFGLRKNEPAGPLTLTDSGVRTPDQRMAKFETFLKRQMVKIAKIQIGERSGQIQS